MSKSKGRLLAELLSSDGKVKSTKSALTITDGKIAITDVPVIPNSKLEQSAVTIAGESLSLGGTLLLNTGHITEHTNLYFTDARADARIVNAGSANWNTAYGWGDHSTQSYATQSYVGTAISNLVDSSPATLDTLNELAAALGDDPNFATTTATAIGLKAPLASPSFTGIVKVANGGSLNFDAASSGNFDIAYKSSDDTFNIINNSSSATMGFHTNSTERMKISSTGVVTVHGVQGRPVTIDSGISTKAAAGGWAMAYAFEGSSGTDRGGFGGFGDNDGLTYYYIGPSYNASIMTIGTNNIVAVNGDLEIGAASTNGSKLRVNGKIVAGDIGSTSGDIILEGYYGNGATVVIGSEYSSGGVFLGYGVQPSTTNQGQFLSSSPAALSQGAYVVSDTHKWYTVTSGSSVAVGSQLTTMTERMRLKSNGYFGIGTDAPRHGLTVSDDTGGDDPNLRRITIKSATHGVNSGFRFDSESANGTARGGGYYFQPGDTDDTTYLGLTASDSVTHMVVTRAGNVGIGATVPNTRLQIASSGANPHSTTLTQGSNHSGLKLVQSNNANDMVGVMFGTGTDTNGSHWSGITGSRSNFASHWGTQLNFYTHNDDLSNIADSTQKMVITGTGRVGIGVVSPAGKLHVTSSGADGIVLDQDTTSTNNSSRLFLNSTNGNWAIFNNAGILKFNHSANVNSTSGSQGASLTNAGLLTVVSLTESSSERYKENIKPISNGLDIITQLNPVMYDRIDNGTKDETGLIAEEVFKVLPNVVAFNEEGDIESIKYTRLIAYLVDAVKTLSADLEKLKNG